MLTDGRCSPECPTGSAYAVLRKSTAFVQPWHVYGYTPAHRPDTSSLHTLHTAKLVRHLILLILINGSTLCRLSISSTSVAPCSVRVRMMYRFNPIKNLPFPMNYLAITAYFIIICVHSVSGIGQIEIPSVHFAVRSFPINCIFDATREPKMSEILISSSTRIEKSLFLIF